MLLLALACTAEPEPYPWVVPGFTLADDQRSDRLAFIESRTDETFLWNALTADVGLRLREASERL